MQFDSQLLSGTLVKRYKRFFADIQLDSGQVITAHCPNTGSMQGVLTPGNKVWVSHVDDPKRKLKYTWQYVEVDGVAIGVNTQNPNRLVQEALHEKRIQELTSYNDIRSEVKYGEENSRIDFLLENDSGEKCFVEVKNVHYAQVENGNQTAIFPDSVTTRGVKHLNELMRVVDQGHRAVVIYCLQRSDCKVLRFGAEFDPDYAATAQQALDHGVEMFVYTCILAPSHITLNQPIKLMR